MTLSRIRATAARSRAAFSRPAACRFSVRMSKAALDTAAPCRVGIINVAASNTPGRSGTVLRAAGFAGNVKVHVDAYGCTQNFGEARQMSQLLLRQGHDVLAAETDADAHLLVTCAVIERTELDMVKRMRALAATGKPLVV